MLDLTKCKYKIKEDISTILEAEELDIDRLAELSNISRGTILSILKGDAVIGDSLEKFYSFVYKRGYRLNTIKEDFLKDSNSLVLFHGSKNGLNIVKANGSRLTCDFGSGFYLGETYNQALSFVCENEKSSIYSFSCDLSDLKIVRLDCSLKWMLIICYYRNTIKQYKSSPIIKKYISEIENADVIVAPIANNRMFYIMSQFADGDINSEVALHSLSASKLGLQYVFKTDKAISKLKPIEQYFVSIEEKMSCIKAMASRTEEIETKLKLAKREFKNGLYIEELLK